MIVLQGIISRFLLVPETSKWLGPVSSGSPGCWGMLEGLAIKLFTNKSSGNGGGEVPMKQVYQVGSN